MAENENRQGLAREEEEMAGGPVSAGASNKSAPMNSGSGSSNQQGSDSGNYNKLLHSDVSSPNQGSGMGNDQTVSSPAGGTLPSSNDAETGTSRGGVATSDNTVSAGGSSTGRLAGAGLTSDRGTPTVTGMDTSTNTKGQLDQRADDVNGESGNAQQV